MKKSLNMLAKKHNVFYSTLSRGYHPITQKFLNYSIVSVKNDKQNLRNDLFFIYGDVNKATQEAKNKILK